MALTISKQLFLSIACSKLTHAIMETRSQIEMPENKTIISVEEDRELNYWSNKFGIAKDELRDVIRRGGTFTEAIEKYLQKITFAV
jgi:hypothetical protein